MLTTCHYQTLIKKKKALKCFQYCVISTMYCKQKLNEFCNTALFSTLRLMQRLRMYMVRQFQSYLLCVINQRHQVWRWWQNPREHCTSNCVQCFNEEAALYHGANVSEVRFSCLKELKSTVIKMKVLCKRRIGKVVQTAMESGKVEGRSVMEIGCVRPS